MMQSADLASLEDAVGRRLHLGVEAVFDHDGMHAHQASVMVGKPRRVAAALRELPSSHRGLQGTTEVMVPSVRIFA